MCIIATSHWESFKVAGSLNVWQRAQVFAQISAPEGALAAWETFASFEPSPVLAVQEANSPPNTANPRAGRR